ncbi:hypothetical protein ANO14919_000310 [Xylariales sp. No.14919]|nr:hypothetical protein ANO14919_000310 [Xylariales sp. No.14919]
MDHSTTTIHVDTLGLTLLYPPTSEAGSRAPPVVNIIFVHGLRGHPRETWEYPAPVQQDVVAMGNVRGTEPGTMSAKKSRSMSKLRFKFLRSSSPAGSGPQVADRSHPGEAIYWPADLLPLAVPRAKIWTYGYNADISGGFFRSNNQNSILEHGNDLMVKVERALRDELPIIFVAHSVGGLVVKVAINDMHSSIDPRYQRLSHRIWAAVFCGCPHRGSDAAAWGKLASNLVAMTLMDTNSRLLSDLQVDSRTLSRIQADFKRALHRTPLRIHSFQEGRALTGMKGLDSKVVDDFSSKLDWAPETIETIDADHREMVKKPGMKDISDILKDLEQEAVAVAAAQAISISELPSFKEQVGHHELQSVAENPARKARTMELLRKLYTSPYGDRKDRNPDRVDGTCQWFINHQLFQTWQESKTSNLLWVSADPGCGKSVLTKYLVDDFLSGTDKRMICYFFFKDEFEDQRCPASALCCILRQIFLQRPDLLTDEILERFERDGEKLLDSFRGLWDILIGVASEYGGELVCILDALDECGEHGQSLIAEAMCKLYGTERSQFFLKFLLTSRPYVHIQRCFRILETRLPTIHLSGENEVEVEKISKEIDIVIRKNVENLGVRLQLLPKEQEILQHELTRNPNRTYLWVYLMFDVINHSINITEDALREVIRNVPESVDAAYDRILCRSRDREKAIRLLHIVVAAERPLSLSEMALALAIKESDRSYADLKLEPVTRFRDTVRELCGLFVTVQGSKIYLLHQTAKEFLVQQEFANATGSLNLEANRFQWKSLLRPAESHRIVAEICIWHLLFDEFTSSHFICDGRVRQYIRDHIFVNYSAKHWASHFRKALIQNDSPMQHSTMRLFEMERVGVWFGIYRQDLETKVVLNNVQDDCLNVLRLVSYFGLEGVGKLLLERGAKVEPEGEDVQTPLWCAVNEGHEAVVRLLLENGANVKAKTTSEQWTALHVAATNGHGGVVQLLLENGADIRAMTASKQQTALDMAVQNGHEAVIQVLLKHS